MATAYTVALAMQYGGFHYIFYLLVIMVCVRRSHVPWYSRRLNMWHFFLLINCMGQL